LNQFHETIASINMMFAVDNDVTVSYSAAPYGVYCLINSTLRENNPLGDQQFTFVPGFDTYKSTQLGEDDVLGSMFLREANPSGINVVIEPVEFTEGSVPEWYFIKLPVNIPGYNFNINGKNASSWGFVSSLIHWSRLMENIGMNSQFGQDISFYVTRTDSIFNQTSGEYYDKVVPLSKSNHFDYSKGNRRGYVHTSVELLTSNGIWKNEVIFHCSTQGLVFYLRTVGVILCSILAFLLAVVLIQRKENKNLLYKIMPERVVTKIKHDETVVELYSQATIFFCDVVNYSSLRDKLSPVEVMKLLNEIYSSFDEIVEKYGIYKVETIGDSYMAVAGATDKMYPQESAEKIALLAIDVVKCVENFKSSDEDKISVRCGISSGPVIAGVVGSDMPRYCFFGDTVHTASRMESSSKEMCIQCSSTTYDLLNDAPNYSFHFQERTKSIRYECPSTKDCSQTFWINDASNRMRSSLRATPDIENGDMIQGLLEQPWNKVGKSKETLLPISLGQSFMTSHVAAILEGRMNLVLQDRNPSLQLSELVRSQIRDFVSEIIARYNKVEYHSFEHAFHVTISMNSLVETLAKAGKRSEPATEGIYTDISHDYFMQFMLGFSALIHDVCHLGMSNKMLESLDHDVTKKFDGSTAERNSIHVTIEILNKTKYRQFREVIFPTIQDKIMFSKILFWSILCTDIATSDRLNKCKDRFNAINSYIECLSMNQEQEDKFDPNLCPAIDYIDDLHDLLDLSNTQLEESKENFIINKSNLERCVVSEHLMQVADVAHLTQDWETFLKWNLRLYKELMECHKKDLMPDPSNNWAPGQIGFFSGYVIPLAERTEKCIGKIKGLSLAHYAQLNKARWETEGERISEIFINGVEKGECENVILMKCYCSENVPLLDADESAPLSRDLICMINTSSNDRR